MLTSTKVVRRTINDILVHAFHTRAKPFELPGRSIMKNFAMNPESKLPQLREKQDATDSEPASVEDALTGTFSTV